LSIRPQNITLTRDQTAATGLSRWTLQGTIRQRAYLGEFWDYVVTTSGSDTSLRVTAPPADVFEVGDAVRLAIDPAFVVFLPPQNPG
jgi:iron(III) transport system ATP-binding protein